jgi:hypothetical protein
MTSPGPLIFQAAVERPLSVVFQDVHGDWIGHDYRVEVVTEREGLDAFDVVMDFRDLEGALEGLLTPLDHRLLSGMGLEDPLALARRLFADLSPTVPPPARLVEVALRDGRGGRLAVRSAQP